MYVLVYAFFYNFSDIRYLCVNLLILVRNVAGTVPIFPAAFCATYQSTIYREEEEWGDAHVRRAKKDGRHLICLSEYGNRMRNWNREVEVEWRARRVRRQEEWISCRAEILELHRTHPVHTETLINLLHSLIHNNEAWNTVIQYSRTGQAQITLSVQLAGHTKSLWRRLNFTST